MITLIKNLPGNIIGYSYDDEVTAADYEKVLFPAIEAGSKKSKGLNVLCRLGENFKGFKLDALKEDMETGIKYFKEWKKIAFVSDKEWMNHIIKAFGFLLPAKVMTFENKEMNAAIKSLLE